MALLSSLINTSLSSTSLIKSVAASTIRTASTSTSPVSSATFPRSLLKSMSATTTVAAGAFGTPGRTASGGSTFRFTPAGAAAIEAVRASAASSSAGIFTGGDSRGDVSLIAPGATDIVDDAAGTSGIAGVLAGSGSRFDRFRSEIVSKISAGSALDSAISERTAGKLQLTVERILTDPREFRAKERGTPPIPPEEGEEYHGPESMRLMAHEKPSILAVIEEDIRENGTPNHVTLLIKKLTSERYRAIEYTIFKKSIFIDSSYDGGTVLPGTSEFGTSLSPRYTEAVAEAGFRLPDVISYTDSDIDAGRVYAYKVKVVYDGDTDKAAEEKEEAETMVTAIFGSDPSSTGGAGGFIPSLGTDILGIRGGTIADSVMSAIGAPAPSTGGSTTSTGGSGGSGLPGFSGGGGIPGGSGIPGF